MRAIADPLRTTILSLLHERAATVTELAAAVGRPKSTVAYHVEMLTGRAVRVVRTRRVRAIEERFYGRTARMFYVGVERVARRDLPPTSTTSRWRRAESQGAFQDRQLWGVHPPRPHRPGEVKEFWRRAMDLVQEFDRLPRPGTLAYGFAIGVYPMPEYPVLPDADAGPGREPAE